MIKINLLVVRIPKAHLLIGKQIFLFGLLLLVSIIVSVVWRSNVSAEVVEIETEISKTQRQIASLAKVEKIKNDYEEKQKRREDILRAIKKLQARRVGPRPFLEDLNLMLPLDIWVTSIVEKNFSITVRGYSFSNPAVADLMREMENSEHFKNVELTEIEKATVQKEEVKKFTITSTWAVSIEEEETEEPKADKKNKGKKA